MFQIVLAVVALAASAYSYRMAKKAAKQQNQGRAGLGVNRFGTDEPLDIIYGTRRVAPCVVYQGVKDVVEKDIPNETYYGILVWGVGPVDSISNLHFDDLPYTQFGSFGSSGNGQRIEHCLGHKDQTMPAWFRAEAPDDMKDMRFCGVAVTYVKLVMDKEFKRYPQGRPEFKATITARSANPIEALKDYFCNADYGCSFSEQDWDDDFNATMRNLCNTVVDEQRLFECNIVLSTDAPLMDNVRDLLQTCRGYLIEGQNGLRVEIDRQKDAVMHIAESMLTSGMSTSSVNINERYNSVTIRYPDKENNYQINEVTFPAQSSDLHDKWLAEDNYVPLTKEETVEGIDNYKSAHQYAEVLARQSRNGMTLNVSVNFFVGEQLEEMDVVTFESKLRGWEAKPFSVREIEYTERDVKLKLVEYQDSNYLWHPKPPKPDYPNTQLPNPNQVAAPSGLSFARSESTQSVGRLSWSSPAGFIESYDVRITGNDEVIWQQNTKLNFIDVPVLLSGRYTFAVRAIGAVAASGWSVLDADITAPSAEFTVEVDAGNTYVILRPRSQNLAWGTEYEFWFDGELRGRGVAWQLEGLSPDTEYQFQVRAVNAVGQSRFQTVTATTTNDASVILDILDGKITRDILDEHLNSYFDSLDESIESLDEKLDSSVSQLSDEVDAVSKAAQQESQAIRDSVSELSDEVDAVSKAAQQESKAIRESVSELSDEVDAVSKSAQQESKAIRDSVSELSDEVDAVSKAAQQESKAIRDSVSELSDEVDQRFSDTAITIDDVRDELNSTAESVNIQLSSLSRTAQDLSKSSFSMASSMQAFMQEHERRLLEGETLVDAVVYRNPETGIIVNRAFAYTEAKYSEAQLAIDGVAATIAITAQQIERLETETGKQLIEAKAAIELNASKISQKASYSEVSEIVSGALDAITPAYSWQFNSSAEGWVGATFVEASSTIIGTQFERSNIAFNADENPVLRLRLKASENGRLSWNGGAQNVVIKHPGDTDSFELVIVKLSASDGWTGEVTSLRIDMDAEIDSIEVGKPSAAELQLQDVSYRLAMAEQELDAANARWSVYVTQDYWNANSLKLTDVRQEIDGFDATYKISATLKQLDESGTVEKANAAQQWIDASESTITSLVIAYNAAPGSTNDQLNEQASQLNAAEQKINALAGEISQTVFSVTELENKGDKAKGYDQLMASFQDFIRTGEYETEKISLSYAQQKINAHSDELSSHARSLLQLFAAKDEHQASLIRLDKVSSDNAKAIAESSTELKASIAEEQKARIASLEQVVTDAEQSLAQAKQLLESQMSEQNQSLISRIDEVQSTAESELAESTKLLEASIAEEQKARIASLEQVVTDAEQSLAQAKQLLESQMSEQNQSLISRIDEVQSTAESELAESTKLLEASIAEEQKSRIASLEQVVTDAEQSLAQAKQLLESQMSEQNQSLISRIDEVQSTAESELAESTKLLEASIAEEQKARIASLEQVVTDAEQSLAQAKQLLESQMSEQNQSLISRIDKVQSDASQSLSSSEQLLSSQIGDVSNALQSSDASALQQAFSDYAKEARLSEQAISLSYAHQKLESHTTELEASARSLMQLFAAKDEQQASLTRLDKVSSDNAKAIAESTKLLEASIAEEQQARIASLEQVVTDAEQSLAQAKQLLESQMSEQNQSLISRIDEVQSTAESELAESTKLLEASIAEEQKSRIASLEQVVTDAEQSLAQAKQLLESQMSEQNQSLISRIDEVQSTAESELAESTKLLEASIAEEQKARIASLEQVVTDAEQSLAQAKQLLESQMSEQNQSLISRIDKVQSDASQSLSSSEQLLSSQIGDVSNALQSSDASALQQAFSDYAKEARLSEQAISLSYAHQKLESHTTELEASARSLMQLFAAKDEQQASLTRLDKVSSDNAKAIAESTKLLEASIAEEQQARIASLEQVVTDAEQSLAQAKQLLESQMSEQNQSLISRIDEVQSTAESELAESTKLLEASIAEEQKARIASLEQVVTDAEQSLAQATKTLSAALNEQEARVDYHASAFVDNNGQAVAKGGMTTNVNGKVTGFVSSNDGKQSSLDIIADHHRIGIMHNGNFIPLLSLDNQLRELILRGRMILSDGYELNSKEAIQAQAGAGVYTLTLRNGVFPSDAVATQDFISAYKRKPVLDDHLTYRNAAGSASSMKRFNGSGWTAPTMIIHGDQMTLGSMHGNRIIAGTEVVAPHLRGGTGDFTGKVTAKDGSFIDQVEVGSAGGFRVFIRKVSNPGHNVIVVQNPSGDVVFALQGNGHIYSVGGGHLNNLTIGENCNVLGNFKANQMIGDLVGAEVLTLSRREVVGGNNVINNRWSTIGSVSGKNNTGYEANLAVIPAVFEVSCNAAPMVKKRAIGYCRVLFNGQVISQSRGDVRVDGFNNQSGSAEEKNTFSGAPAIIKIQPDQVFTVTVQVVAWDDRTKSHVKAVSDSIVQLFRKSSAFN